VHIPARSADAMDACGNSIMSTDIMYADLYTYEVSSKIIKVARMDTGCRIIKNVNIKEL
jgi:hypothetical protein